MVAPMTMAQTTTAPPNMNQVSPLNASASTPAGWSALCSTLQPASGRASSAATLLIERGNGSVDLYRDRYTRNTPTVMDARLTDTTGMVRIGGSFELRLTPYWNLFTTFEGNLLGTERNIYDGLFRTESATGARGNQASVFTGRLGFTYKFH